MTFEAQVVFSATAVARFCDVDPKTIHNWVSRGKLSYTRTTGRHLRFRRVELIEFLRAYGYPIPAALSAAKSRVALVHASSHFLSLAERALHRRFAVASFGDPFDALLGIASFDPDAIALDADGAWIDPVRYIERLRKHPGTQHLRIIVQTDDTRLANTARAAGAQATAPRSHVDALIETLEMALPFVAMKRR